MIRQILFLTVIAVVYCQYPQQRAPPPRYRPAPEEYAEEEYAPPPSRQAPPPPPPRPAFRASNARPLNDVYRPASVHYVNIGLELAGDYKFGYDTGKGNDGQSFREETRLPDGTVQGAYGYVDETGRQRIVKYTAGKDGFKAEGDVGPEGAPKTAPRTAPAPAPQPTYRAPPAQPAYAAPQPQPRPQPQPSYRPPPPAPAQPAYRAPPPARPAHRAAPQPAYRAEPRPQAAPRPRPAPRPVETYDEESDYDYPNNDIGERRLVPVDTTLFNYNIGTSHN